MRWLIYISVIFSIIGIGVLIGIGIHSINDDYVILNKKIQDVNTEIEEYHYKLAIDIRNEHLTVDENRVIVIDTMKMWDQLSAKKRLLWVTEYDNMKNKRSILKIVSTNYNVYVNLKNRSDILYDVYYDNNNSIVVGFYYNIMSYDSKQIQNIDEMGMFL